MRSPFRKFSYKLYIGKKICKREIEFPLKRGIFSMTGKVGYLGVAITFVFVADANGVFFYPAAFFVVGILSLIKAFFFVEFVALRVLSAITTVVADVVGKSTAAFVHFAAIAFFQPAVVRFIVISGVMVFSLPG